MLHLFLALCWLAVGVALLTWRWFGRGELDLNIFGSGISLGWFALVLAVYNLARWWSSRSYAIRRQQAIEEAWRRQHRSTIHERPPATPDPNFIFTDEPPAVEREP
jgi:hypothetical protein